jgi:amidophosphoribosyltransferase
MGLKTACGVFGIYSFKNEQVSGRIYNGLLAIQHRGQDSAGIATYNGGNIKLKKGMGLVSDVFGEKDLRNLKGRIGVGSVRYPTTGTSVIEDAQPFFISSTRNGLAMVHNGNLVNYTTLKKKLNEDGWHISSGCDSEVILKVFGEELAKENDISKAAGGTVDRLEGSYCEVGVTGRGELFAFRDPYGFRPLCFGKNKDYVIFASESTALDINDVEFTDHVKPGELIIVDKKGFRRKQIAKPKRAHCMFEYVYFSRPDSILDAGSVYDVRLKLGKNLAKSRPAKADAIVAVPDTARPAAEGFSRESGIKVEEGLIKNRYVARTFIMPEQKIRDAAVKNKLNPLRNVLKGKRVILVDDSIVRGTTVKGIIQLVRDAGAKKIDLRITCPPIISPCFYGIDISKHDELIAFNFGKDVEKIRKALGADSLGYQTIDGLVDAIGIGKKSLCMACLDERYPTPLANEIAKKMKMKSKEERKAKRYWEL